MSTKRERKMKRGKTRRKWWNGMKKEGWNGMKLERWNGIKGIRR